MEEGQSWAVVVCLPGLALAALAGYATGAGCYAITMNCFSITDANTPLTRDLLWFAAFLPYAVPAYLPVALVGLGAVWRAGARGARVWLLAAPPLFAASLHASCALFAGLVLPERRIAPSIRLDLAVLAATAAYALLAWLATPRISRRLRRESPWKARPRSA